MSTDQPPDPSASTVEMPATELAALEASIARTEAEWQRLLAGTYQGTDSARLVTAVVDGQGIVVTVTFAKTIARHEPAVVEEAVLAAVAAAQQVLGDALGALAVEVAAPAPQHAGPGRERAGADDWRTADLAPDAGAELPGLPGGVVGRADG
ncbi:hypothetical protein GCM10022225_16050 [Plantactinospora mayteni]|uniref:YbaB/EbfC DNA-binding family protein n=1 Tax=Plantactinospora mayteni TaxID=566021 RepID=A0ABQ4EG96_9ACTN|nr:YbaB/EbfC family nucleoid-associated protein [Plantactinospora mayteni]GIG93679.1 hypothetical protein Pma05_02520 [Plantactinospora mayteni]